MGTEIETAHFATVDFDQFHRNLKKETALLKAWFDEDIFANTGEQAGCELEIWLIDRDCQPAPINEPFLNRLNIDSVVPELSQFNVEINSAPHRLEGHFLSSLKKELEQTWKDCRSCAKKLDSDIVMIGILPTIQEGLLTSKMMSPMQRYRALNEQVFKQRHGQPMHLNIEGKDHLILSHHDVMLESAATSLQIHLQLDPKYACRIYNASLIASAPMVAVGANSPYLFGKDLWDDTRIPLFEQAVSIKGKVSGTNRIYPRVTFGRDYVKKSLFELFQENLTSYPVLLPAIFQADAAQMNHLRLHNGTIWRWNRPIVGLGADGRVHLRTEHRVVSSGPSIVDVIANIALYLGLATQLARLETPPESQLSFADTRKNFYRAAKEGLHASIRWLDGKEITVQALLLEQLLPLAQQGLGELGIDRHDIDFYLNDVMRNRVLTAQNGAAWQRKFISKHPGDFQGLTAAYLERQEKGDPVHQWKL